MRNEHSIPEGSLYSQWQDAPVLQKLILAAVAVLIVVFTLKNVVFYGQSRRIDNLRRSLARQEQTISSCRSIAQNLPEYEKRLTALRQNQETRLLHIDDLPLALSKLTGLNSQEVRITNIRPGQETVSDNHVRKALFVSGEGTLDSLAGLIEQIETVLPACTVDRVVFTRRTTSLYYCELFLAVHLSADR